MNVKVITYTGNGNNARGITGIGFSSDYIFITNDTGELAVFRFSSQGAGDIAFYVAAAGAETANLIESIDADGFTIGDSNNVNELNAQYYCTCIEDDNGDFLVGNYTGDGTTPRTIDTNCGFTPAMAFTGGENADSWPFCRLESMPVNDSSQFSRLAAYANNKITGLVADGFVVTNQIHVNEDTTVYHYAVMQEVAGHSDFDTYTGNATDDRGITGVDFQPDDIWVHTDQGRDKSQTNKECTDYTMTFCDQEDGRADIIKSIDADGFTITANADINADGEQFDGMCLKEGSTGGPATNAPTGALYGSLVGPFGGPMGPMGGKL